MRDSANEVTTKPVNGIAGAPDGHVRFNRGVGGAALRGVNDINLIVCVIVGVLVWRSNLHRWV